MSSNHTMIPASVATPYLELTSHLETANLNVAMAGLSIHTQRAYRRWIKTYLESVTGSTFDLDALDLTLALATLQALNLSAWPGRIKATRPCKASLGVA